MAAITALTENFEGGSAGSDITTSNTFFDKVGSPTPVFVADSVEGTRSFTPSSLSSSVSEVDFAGVTTLWIGFYLKLTADATSSTAIWNLYGDGATSNKIADLRVASGGSTLQIRSVNTSRWTSTSLALNVWHRIAIGVTVGSTIQLKIYSGANLHSTTVSQQSGSQSNTNTSASDADNVRFGLVSGDSTLGFRLDRVRGDNASETAAWSDPGAQVDAVTATASGLAPPPSFSANASVTAVRATGTALVLAPTAENVATAVAATATAGALAPSATGGATVTAVVATATATAPAPAAYVTADLVTIAASATAEAPIPVVHSVHEVVGVTATGSSMGIPASISSEMVLDGGGPAEATALAIPPTVTTDANVVAVVATGTADGVIPEVQTDANVVVGGPATAEATVREDVLIHGYSATFTMPSFEEPFRTSTRPVNYHRLTYATSLVRINGVLTQVRSPGQALLVAAGEPGVDYFIGGHIYQLSEATAQELVAAGYEIHEE